MCLTQNFKKYYVISAGVIIIVPSAAWNTGPFPMALWSKA